MKENNVIQLNQWKARTNLTSSAAKSGWNITQRELTHVDKSAAFYICEPLQTGYTAMGIYNRKVLKSLVKAGTKTFGSKSRIFDVVASCTMDLIASESNSADMLDAVITGNMINFAGTQTAKAALREDDYCHFGAIIYHNPLRSDNVHVSFRPMALSESNTVLEPEVLCQAVCAYILNDHEKHPEYFEGLNVVEVVTRFSAKMGFSL